jgi:hypothetical protein
MTKLLLLDDSVTIQKVVRLTFASQPTFEIETVRTEAEARSFLMKKKPDLVIGYARFCADRTAQFFDEIQKNGTDVLVLAESNENKDNFERVGLKHFLKKPFLSEELKKNVANLLQKLRGAPTASEPLEEKFFQVSPALPPPPPPITLRNAAPRPPEKPPKPAFVGGAAARLDFLQETGLAGQDSDSPLEWNSSASPFAAQEQSIEMENPFALETSEPSTPDLPPLTMDVDALEKSYRATLSEPPPSAPRIAPAPKSFAPVATSATNAPLPTPNLSVAPNASSSAASTSVFSGEDPTLTFTGHKEERKKQENREFESGSEAKKRIVTGEWATQIELPSEPLGPLVLEDVVVNTPYHLPAKEFHESVVTQLIDTAKPHSSTQNPMIQSSTSHSSASEVQEMVDEALMRALERAVPAKIESKIEAHWPRLCADVTGRLKPEVTNLLNGWVEKELRAEIQKMIGKEFLGIAKDVVREEIRRLLEEK